MGLEAVIRPVVFPNIRPGIPRVLPPTSDPTQGFCTLSGGGGSLIELTHSYSFSYTHTAPHKEVKRQEDKERHYQVDENNKVNKKNFIDVMRLKKVLLKGKGQENSSQSDDSSSVTKLSFADPPPPEVEGSVKILEEDITTETDPGV